jgi:hypothetical protein
VLKATICEETARQCAAELCERLRSIVLTGSLARDEATFIEQAERWTLLGDAEFLLIFRNREALPSTSSLNSLREKIEHKLLERGLLGKVSLSACHPAYLRKLPPHIFTYELRECGQVIWGDQETLALVPSFSSIDISLEDAWRLLCNRMIEVLEIAHELPGQGQALPRQVHYRTLKLYLDMATSLLAFAGFYEPTYLGRAERLRVLAGNHATAQTFPFELRRFSQRVNACTQRKLFGIGFEGASAVQGEDNPGFSFWEEAISYARLLWRWELTRLTNAGDRVSDRQLWQRWMQMQPFRCCLRGWLYVLRKRGWHRSWRQWPRWTRLAWRTSPRYCVYAAASQLFFRLPGLLGTRTRSPLTGADWKELRGWLPMAWEAEPGDAIEGFRRLSSDVARNYHDFLEGTRS